MSFRLRIVLMTTALMTFLFSVGGSMLIHSSFQNSLQKEEETLVGTNEMILRVVAYIGKDGKWVTEEELIGVMENLCQQDSIHALRLVHGEEIIYIYQNSNSVLTEQNNYEDLKENQVRIFYFESEKKDNYMQSTMRFFLNGKTYYLDMSRNLLDIYEIREEQLQLFQVIFGVISIAGMMLSWLLATYLTRHLRKLTHAAKELGEGNLSYRANIRTEDEVGALAVAFDTMAERLDENITLLKENAEQRERFMGAFTHELKTPMTSIIGYADLLRTQKLNKKDETDALDYIFSEAKRLENMSLKMLDLFVADKKEMELKPCTPAKLTAYTVKHLKSIFAEENVEIEVWAEQGCCMLEPDLFQTLLINLLDNAKKAMEQGGKIIVKADMTEQGCKLCVKDEGRGIPKEACKHLTEAFYRVDKARARKSGSAGLGLSLCEKIVELHHGDMFFDSEEGVGTEVTVFLNGGRYEDKKK
ncbi:MAG: HAMP domain-containing histidine kinase [Agathobacter sp.]|nr:HAMP domain-containing histidine kinase [Agathobacter sp.]